MKVSELIECLKTFPQDLPVVYAAYSELCILEAKDIEVGKAQPARPDGWVHHQRKDKPMVDYLIFPGS